MLLEKVVIIESAIYTYTYVHAHKSYTAYATRLVFFLHALKVPNIVYHSLHRKIHYSDEKSA